MDLPIRAFDGGHGDETLEDAVDGLHEGVVFRKKMPPNIP